MSNGFYPSNWADAGLPPKIFGLNAYVAVPWVVMLAKANLWTASFAFVGTVTFAILGYYGFGPLEAMGRSLDWIVGNRFYANRKIQFYEETDE